MTQHIWRPEITFSKKKLFRKVYDMWVGAYENFYDNILIGSIYFSGVGLASTNGLQRHIPRVSRAITKVVNSIENLDRVSRYLEMLGKIHQQIGIEVNTWYNCP